MKRWIAVALVIATVATGWILSRGPKGVAATTAIAERGTIRAFVEEQARTRLPEIARITMPLQGRVLPIELKEGDEITSGQIVARMDPVDLDTDLQESANTVRAYDKNLEQLALAIKQTEQTVLASREKYEFFEREFGRVLELFKRNSAAESRKNEAELKMIESRVDLRKDELEREMYAIGRTVFQLLRDTEVGKKDKASRDRDRAVIRSPVDGIVLQRQVSNERVLQAGEVLLEIGQMDDLEVLAEVLTQDVVRISVGDPVDIIGSPLGATPLAGRVSRIFPRGFTKVSSLGVEQQRVNVIMDFDAEAQQQIEQLGLQLGADYRLRVKIYTDQKDDTVVLPRSAIFRSQTGDWQVFAVVNNRAELRTVEIGLKNDFRVEIESGVKAGETIIVAPDAELVQGQFIETPS